MKEEFRRQDLEKISSIDTEVKMLANNLEVYQDANRQNMVALTGMFERHCEKIDNLSENLVRVAEKQEAHNGHIINLLDRQGEQSQQISDMRTQIALNSDYRARMGAFALRYGGGVVAFGAAVWAFMQYGPKP